jgi:hypothetical protein
MKKEDLIQLLKAKITSLQTLKSSVERLGDLQRAVEIQIEIDDTQATLNDTRSS